LNKEKIVFVSSRFPLPTDKGDKLRAFHQIQQFSLHFDVYLFALNTEKISSDSISTLNQYCKKIEIKNFNKFQLIFQLLRSLFNRLPFQVNYFYNKATHIQLKKFVISHQIQLAYFQLIRTSEYKKGIHFKSSALDYMDALSLGMSRRAAIAPFYLKPLLSIEAKRLQVYEKAISSQFQAAFVIAEKDRQEICPIACPIHIAANGVEIGHDAYAQSKNYNVLFTGNMSYAPNINAALFLVEDIMPIVWAIKPNITVAIVGTSPHQKVLNLKSDLVKVTGRVANMADYYTTSDICVAPMRIGSGLQNKLLEAMSYAVPCITTHLANDALMAQPNVEILVKDTAKDISDAILKLLENETLKQQISEMGYNFVKEKYSWKKNTGVIIRFFNSNL
jgi:polysaccharide biosynthesis protein PslH